MKTVLYLGDRSRWISVSLRPAWSTELVPEHRETLSQKTKKQKTKLQTKKFPYDPFLAIYHQELKPESEQPYSMAKT